MELGLKNKKALVFGASSGIGRAIAQSLVGEGAQVALVARDLEKLRRASHDTGAGHYYSADLFSPGAAKEVTEKAIREMGGLDILVTNTGGPKRGTFLEITEDQWQQDYQSLWMSVVESLKVALPMMKKQNFGRIVMVTSYVANQPRLGLTTSNGLRAGLVGLCRSISQEYAPFGITANIIQPGLTDTDRLKELNLNSEKVKALVPAGRLGQPAEVGDLAVYLCSARAGYITAQNITISGGA